MVTDSANLLRIVDGLRDQPREAATVEFKMNWELPRDIGEYISALGNAAALERHDRAWLVWGVDNVTHAVKGTSFDPFSAKGEGNQPLIMWLTQKIAPRPDFKFHELAHPEGRLVLLEIHPPRTAPLAFDGVRYIRIDSHKTSLAQHADKEARLWDALGGQEDWTGQIVSEASLDDLDPRAIEFARAKFIEHLIKSEADTSRHEKIRSDAQQWDIPTLLNKAHIAKQGRITRAALLLLGRDEAAHFLSPADAKISWILRDKGNKAAGGQHFGLPLILASDALFNRIRNVPVEYMPDGTLFPTPVLQYDPWVIREALHNCIAHQDYRLGGKINVVEHPDKLVFSNLGTFIPPSIEWMLDHHSPPEHYRNQWLIDGMVRLRMIDQIGSGIRRMFETQRDRFFPLPDYIIDADSTTNPRVEVSLSGKILDAKYTQALMRRPDLDLGQVILLDKIQKRLPIKADVAKRLRTAKLIEGRSPNYYISAQVAEWTAQKARYIRNRGLDDGYYQRLVVEYLHQYKRANRKELDELLVSKLPDVLSVEQKQHKVRNLLQALRREGVIRNAGTRGAPMWVLYSESRFAKTDGEGGS
ncbi:MAG: putative DNA binding domain-containing protein [Sulfuritalea sp.]|nr:putative DNA binding domain-containing protein [Sulfuritalea sp.]